MVFPKDVAITRELSRDGVPGAVTVVIVVYSSLHRNNEDAEGGGSEMTGRRVPGIGLDPYTIDFDSDFFRGKPLNADLIAGEIKAEEVRIRAMGHDFQWLLIDACGSPEMQLWLVKAHPGEWSVTSSARVPTGPREA